MTVERTLRLMAGIFILISVGLGYWVSHYWFLFTAFVGINLFQSGLSNWCPAMTILRKLGMKHMAAAASAVGSKSGSRS